MIDLVILNFLNKGVNLKHIAAKKNIVKDKWPCLILPYFMRRPKLDIIPCSGTETCFNQC